MTKGASIGRRELLAGLAAASALAMASPTIAALPAASPKGDPEPLQHFPGFAEGFYVLGASVLYIDATAAGWAPRGLDPRRLVPVDLAAVDIAELVTKLRKRHWAHAVEHAVLHRLPTDPDRAHALLDAALHLDRAAPRPASRRLHHLSAALASGRASWRAVGTDGRAVPVTLKGASLVPSSN